MSVKKYSVMISGHRTISLEPEFWEEIKRLAKEENISVAALVADIDNSRNGNLSSALRLFVLKKLKQYKHALDTSV